MGCFAYSPVDGASANEIAGALPDEVREERRQRFMEVQAQISRQRSRRFVKRTLDVLIDELHVAEDGSLLQAVGRSAADAPEIDGRVLVRPHPSLRVGEFVKVRITRADDHDLYGSVAR